MLGTDDACKAIRPLRTAKRHHCEDRKSFHMVYLISNYHFVERELKAPDNKGSISRVCALWKVSLGAFGFEYLTSDSHSTSETTWTKKMMANFIFIPCIIHACCGSFKLSNKQQCYFTESSMQIPQNERLEEQKCYYALFTGRTSVKVIHSLYGDRDVMQLSHVSGEMNKCRMRTPTTIPHVLLGGNKCMFMQQWMADTWQITAWLY